MRHARKTNQFLTSRSARHEGAPLHRSWFVKVDRPRSIDPYIDYFGDRARSGPTSRFELERAG